MSTYFFFKIFSRSGYCFFDALARLLFHGFTRRHKDLLKNCVSSELCKRSLIDRYSSGACNCRDVDQVHLAVSVLGGIHADRSAVATPARVQIAAAVSDLLGIVKKFGHVDAGPGGHLKEEKRLHVFFVGILIADHPVRLYRIESKMPVFGQAIWS